MSDYTTNAGINLNVNGAEAVNKLEELRQKAVKLRDAIAQAGEAGNKAEQRNLRKQLKETTRQIQQMESSVKEVNTAIRTLDKASPRELRRTLTKLKKDLNDMERGSEAWNAQISKIQKVRAELDSVNAAMKRHKSAVQLLMSRATQWWAIGQSLIASVSGLTGSISRAVQAYADMDSEMANTQKFTGMTRENVERLNEEFKQMDTRTSREALNRLAQSAGRLGKSSVEDVMGFVRAGDVLKVAMDELGDDAPQIISQLAGIFSLEQEMGTEQAMLAVGSAINSLSQNCAAGAPNLVEFASRLGAIGSQTGMTMDEMLAFGAVLDANRVSMEVSATSIQTVLSRMMADPADFARKAGLSVDEFTAAVKRSSTDGLMVFIERLSELDKMDIARILADLKVQDSGVIRTFNTLAGKIGEVRNQMEASKTAFDEATSAQEEFSVQNNTVQAGLDKAKKKLHELAAELGGQLLPLVKDGIAVGNGLLSVLNVVVGFVARHIAVFGTLTAAVGAYAAGVALSNMRLKEHIKALNLAAVAQKAWRAVALAGTATVALLTGNIAKASKAMRILNLIVKANPLGLALSAIAAVAAALLNLRNRTDALTEANKRLTEASSGYQAELSKERESIDALFGKLDAAKKGTKEYETAKNEIISQYGGYLGGLGLEIEKLNDVAGAYKAITRAAEDSAKARGLKAARQTEDDAFNQVLNEQSVRIADALKSTKWEQGRTKRNLTVREQTKWLQILIEEAQNGTFSRDTKSFLSHMGVRFTDAGTMKGTAGLVEGIAAIMEQSRVRESANARINAAFGVPDDFYAGLDASTLADAIKKMRGLRNVMTEKKGSSKIKLANGKSMLFESVADIDEEIGLAEARLKKLEQEAGMLPELVVAGSPAGDSDSPVPVPSSSGSGGGSPDFSAEQRWYDVEVAKAKIAYATGESDYREYRKKLAEIDADFAKKKLERDDLDPAERKKLEAEQAESERKMRAEEEAIAKGTADELHARNLQVLKERYADEQISDESYREQKFREEIRYLEDLKRVYGLNAEERARVEKQIQEKELDEKLRKQEAHRVRVKRIEDEFFGLSQTEKDEAFQTESEALAEAYNRQLQLAEGNAEEKLRVEEAYQIALKAIRKKYSQDGENGETGGYTGGLQKLDDWINGEKGQQVLKGISAVSNAMSGMFSAYSSMVQAETDIQLAAIEKRYESELAAAEGNTYKTKQIEARKEKEMAKVKNQASKKTYAMQVAQATAQIAQNIISAVGAGMAFGLAAPVMVPLLVGIATATGAVQLVAIKKQQQAAAAQGYSQGGFTRPGRVDEPAGIVHAGEWVASQRLLADPVARPMIDALDYAQRTNTLGSLRMADVRTVRPAYAAERTAQTVSAPDSARQDGAAQTNLMLLGVINRLNRRLDEPFVTVNTVEGDRGIRKAQEEYEKLMRNKSPKSRQ